MEAQISIAFSILWPLKTVAPRADAAEGSMRPKINHELWG